MRVEGYGLALGVEVEGVRRWYGRGGEGGGGGREMRSGREKRSLAGWLG